MHECIATKLMSGADDQIAAGHKVIVDSEVCRGLNYRRILVGFTGDGDDVGSSLLDAAESLSGSRNGLVDNDGLHLRIIGETADDADGGLSFVHEVVRIGDVLDDATGRNRTILLDQAFCTTQIIFRLGDGTGNNTYVEVTGSGLGCCSFLCTLCKQETGGQQDAKNKS